VPRALISILHYNCPDDAIAAARSFQAQTCSDTTLQIFDNQSRPEALMQVERALPDVQVRRAATNLGYTGGNNAAIDQAYAEGYDLVVLCNQDIEVDESAVAQLVETATRNPDAGLVGGVEVCYFTGEVRASGATGYSFWRSRFRWTTDAFSDVRTVDFVQGALVVVTRAAMARGIRFDDRLFLYYDEVDLGLQVREVGLKAYVDGRVRVRHKNRDNFMNPRAAYYHQRNRAYVVRKHGTALQHALFQVYALVIELPVKALVRWLQGHRRFVRASLAGHVDGLLGRMGAGRASRY
jgi:GT2 family glycosyltransferase